MPFLNHRLRTLQTESFRNLGAAFSPSLFLFLSLNFVPKYLKISFLPLCIYKNVEKNRAKTGHFLLQFLPSNHNILWSNPTISSLFHNTASEPPTQHVSIGYFRCTFQSFHCNLGVKNDALLSDKAAKIDMMHSLLPLHRKRLHCILDVSQISLRLTLLFLYGPLLIP